MRQEVIQKAPEQTKKPTPNMTGIPTQMKLDFEQRSGLSFDDVRVHYNSDKPRRIGALAYTQGNQVHIGPGQERHLRHELGHVVQQKQGIVRPTTWINGLPVNDSPELEHAANVGFSVSRGHYSSGSVQSATIQRYRVVMPDQIRVPEGSPGPIFSTNRVVHFPDASVQQDVAEFTGDYGIERNLLSQLEQILADISHSELTDDEKRGLWDNYYRLSGKTSMPQLYDDPMGKQLFVKTEAIYDSGQVDRTKNQTAFVKKKVGWFDWIKGLFGFASEPQFELSSRFKATTHKYIGAQPLLVSNSNKFALSALYSEPKEVYLQTTIANTIKEELSKIDIELMLDQNATIIIPITDTEFATLQGYTISKSSEDKFDSTECDKIRKKQLGRSVANKECTDDTYLFASIPKTSQKYVPWEYHTAAVLQRDGTDSLTLENGARSAWLFSEKVLNIIFNGSMEQHRAIMQEMNKTWYFRMYGPSELGQDIGQQTISRFTPVN